jgi:protoporphyrinogen oxidase
MLGLTLAKRLAEAGASVTLLDATPEIGGLAGAWQLGDAVWDKHYHVTLLSDLRNRQLLAELGLEKDMRWVETRTGFYTDGQLHSMSNTWEFLRFPPLGLIDKLRLGGTIFLASRIRNWRPLERVLVEDWLRKWSGATTFEKIWEPLLKAKLGQRYRATSAAFIWATIARMYAARQSGLKKEMFGYLPGGYARILRRLADTLQAQQVKLQLGEPVDAVTRLPSGQVQVEVTGKRALFDRVVLTIPSPLVARLVPELNPAQRTRHEEIDYLGIVCASVLVKRPLASYYVTNITDAGMPFTAVIEMTTLVDPQQFQGRSLVYLPRYAGAGDEAWDWSDDEVRQRFLTALERMYPDFDPLDVEAFRVSRARHVMALPTLDYSSRLPPMRTSVPGVYAINSAHIVKGTLNVNEVIELAETAFDEILRPELPGVGRAVVERVPPQPSVPTAP